MSRYPSEDVRRIDQQFAESEDERNERLSARRRALKCPGVGRDKDCVTALQFYFSRPVTDDEMRYLHEVLQRAVACVPPNLGH